jgi:diguanylate cyclase (GGDEF)-like protein
LRSGCWFKGAYWIALLIIAAMALASYLLLQQMMAAQQRDEALLAFVAKPGLLAALKEANSEFERNYDLLLERTAADPLSPNRHNSSTIESVLFAKPFHLDYFSTGLAANGWRFISAIQSELGIGGPVSGYLAGRDRARLDETVAKATLAGYTALGERITANSNARLVQMLSTHRTLFFTTLVVIALVALFIFRPMANVIMRRTHELVDARNSMAFIAVHDGLTGLHNRTFLTDHFDTLIKGAHRRRERLAVVQLDLDRFKQINDTLGHAAGDYVLVMTAQRMRESRRASDLCVRLGGDEFVMILNGAGTSEDINGLAKRILDPINEPISFQGATILPGASAGIAVYPVDADNAGDLIVHADLALYSAKKQGGGNFSFFSDELRQELEHRKLLERDLKIAIAEESFNVYFQPQVSLANGAITGVEALVRWNHPERGIISPGEFIPKSPDLWRGSAGSSSARLSAKLPPGTRRTSISGGSP